MKKYLIITIVCLVFPGCGNHTPVIGSRGQSGDKMSQAKAADEKESPLLKEWEKSPLGKLEQGQPPPAPQKAPLAGEVPDACPLAPLLFSLLSKAGGTMADAAAERSRWLPLLEQFLKGVDLLLTENYQKLAAAERLALLVNAVHARVAKELLRPETASIEIPAWLEAAQWGLEIKWLGRKISLQQLRQEEIDPALSALSKTAASGKALFWRAGLYSDNRCPDGAAILAALSQAAR